MERISPLKFQLEKGFSTASTTGLSGRGQLRGATAAGRDPLVDELLQHGQGEHAAIDHDGMEIAHIEFRTEGLLRAGAQLEELALAEHVSEGLRRIGEVAIDFARREILVQATLACHVRDGLVARPVVRMDAGIDNEPRGAKELGLQVPVVLEGILVEAEIEAEL